MTGTAPHLERWWAGRDSNPHSTAYEAAALTVMLPALANRYYEPSVTMGITPVR